MSTNPKQVYAEITETYLRYLDTAYWLRSNELMNERRRVLTETDVLFTDVLLEPVHPYDATIELESVVHELGLDRRVCELVGGALFESFTKAGDPFRIRTHQADGTASVTPIGSCGRPKRSGDLGNWLWQDGIVPASGSVPLGR